MSRSRRLRSSSGRFVPLQPPATEAGGPLPLPGAAPGTDPAPAPGNARGQATGRIKPSQCRVYLRRELANSFRGIVSGFVKQAESGSVPHMKETMLLLDDPGAPKKRRAAGRRLLEQFESMDREPGAADARAPESGDLWRD